jgi:GcrA cell cycle regulator
VEWTDERIEALTRMWRDGLSAAQVARQLGGVSRSAVIGKVHRLGIAGRDCPTRPRALGGRPSTRTRKASAGGVRRPQAGPRTPRPAAAPGVVFEVAPTASIHTLNEHGCRWPIGDPNETGFGFCGRTRERASSYCTGHASMGLRRRDGGYKAPEIDHLVKRYGGDSASERAAEISWRRFA